MKKKSEYETPKIDLVKFKTEDIMSSSGDVLDENIDPDQTPWI